MEIKGYPHCCGMKQLIDWDHPSIDKTENEVHVQYGRAFLTRIVQEGWFKTTGVIMVALNHCQRKLYKDVLTEFGFKEAVGAYNPNSGNDVYLFLWVGKAPVHSKPNEP